MPEPLTLPPIADQPISVILLAHNDDAHLETVLDAWTVQLNTLGRSHEILLVDDGSSDNTATQAETLRARLPSLQVFRLPQPAGIGASLRAGVALAQFPLVLYTTADEQYQPADLPAFLNEIDRVHLVSGFRRWQPVPILARMLSAAYRIVARVLFDFPMPPLPGWLGWQEYFYRLLIRVVFAVRSLDLNCYYVLCRRDIFSRLPIQSDGSFAQTEILAKANFLGYLIGEEIPITYRPREGDRGRTDWFADFNRVRSDPDFSSVALVPFKATEEKDTAPIAG
jgi:glycosyltransferase involved in cell wall biosynthesis